MKVNLSEYRIFYVVAQKGNISRAAKELYISQPAVSKSINRLEESLKTKLFHRSSRGVTLTEAGQVLYEHIDTAFESIFAGELKIQRIRDYNIGQLRIGVSATLCKYLLLPYLKKFVNLYPHIKINIVCQSTFQTAKQLEEGKLDVGLIGYTDRLTGFDFRDVKNIEDIFVCQPSYLDHLRLRMEEEITSTAMILENANLMLLDESNITRRYVDHYMEQMGIIKNQILEVSNMELLIEFAKIGLGVACVIKEFVKEELNKGELIELELDERMGERRVGFAFGEKEKQAKAVRLFLDFIEEYNLSEK
ncbi:MAG: LysR family transcriptional regulator [Lachnospiraceae bacterium]|nr:LysR family transcriptional regulator [Lachnospiraceae bacterium]